MDQEPDAAPPMPPPPVEQPALKDEAPPKAPAPVKQLAMTPDEATWDQKNIYMKS